jgi:hypothetical protein
VGRSPFELSRLIFCIMEFTDNTQFFPFAQESELLVPRPRTDMTNFESTLAAAQQDAVSTALNMGRRAHSPPHLLPSPRRRNSGPISPIMLLPPTLALHLVLLVRPVLSSMVSTSLLTMLPLKYCSQKYPPPKTPPASQSYLCYGARTPPTPSRMRR